MADDDDTVDADEGSGIDSVLRGVAAAPSQVPPVDHVGRIIGRYRIVSVLGRGGMGSVYEADDAELDRKVAIKLVRVHASARGSSTATARRFKRERALTAELEHPNIMPIYDSGVTDDGEPYYVMRIARGEPLDKKIVNATLLADRLALVTNLVAVADAVAFAHSRKIVHRDLKPHNILIGAFGETLVADWGLAKRLDQPDDGAPGMSPVPSSPEGDGNASTRHGEVLGTPAYMAPEQASGEAVDDRTDVYALGAMLHHILAQSPPTTTAIDVPGIPPDLVAVARKAMQADPDDRYQRAQHMADELRRYLAGQIIHARRYTRSELIARWARKHRPELAVGFALSFVLAVGAIVSINRIIDERDVAEAARSIAAQRNNELVLMQARAELTHDPTASIGWLTRYLASGADDPTVSSIATDAASRGVAHDVWRFTHSVDSVAMTADSKAVLVGSNTGTLDIVTLADGTRRTYSAPDGLGERIVASPDGTTVATTDGHEVVRLWNLSDGTSRKLVGEHIGGANIQFTDDGTYVLVRHSGGGARVWRVADGKPIELPGDDRRLVGFIPGSPDLAVVGVGTELSTIELATGARREHTTLDARPFDLMVSGDGATVGVTLFTRVMLWTRTTGTVRTIDPKLGVAALITRSPDGRSFMTCGHTQTEVWLWDIASATASQFSTDEACFRQGFAYAPDGTRFVTRGLSTELRVHGVHEHTLTRLLGHDGAVVDAAFSPDGHWLISAGADHSVRTWQLDAGDVHTLHRTTEIDRVSSGGIVFATDDTGLVAVDVTTGARTPLPGPRDFFAGCTSGDGKVGAVYGTDRRLHVIDLQAATERTLPPIPELAIAGRAATTCNFTGTELAQAAGNGDIVLVDLASGRARVALHLADVALVVTYSHDGHYLALGGRDRMIVVIDPATTTFRRRVELPAPAWQIAWSPDGTSFAAGCNDGAVRIVHIGSSDVRTLTGHVGTATGVTYADRDTLFTAGSDGTIRRYDLASGSGQIVRREPFALESVVAVGRTTFLVTSQSSLSIDHVWDWASLPPSRVSRESFARWRSSVTTANVDASGVVSSP